MDEKNVSFGEIVVGLRRKRGLTQYALAKKIRKDKRWGNLIEHGKNSPRPAGLILFARALDVEPADLFGMLADRLENRDRTVLPPDYEALLDALRTAREQNGLSPDELARRLNRPAAFVTDYEAGDRILRVPELLDIARVLGTPRPAPLSEKSV